MSWFRRIQLRMKTTFYLGEPVRRPPAVHGHLGDHFTLDETHGQGAKVAAVPGPRKIVTDYIAVALGYLYHTTAPDAGGVEEDVVAGEADDALDPLLAGLDGDGVDDAVADADAAAAAAGPVGDEPLVARQEGREHRRAPAVPAAVAVGGGDVAQGQGLAGVEEDAEGVA